MSTAACPPERKETDVHHHRYRPGRADRLQVARDLRRRPQRDQPRRHVRGARRRLTRPRRAVADRRGRVRRQVQVVGRREPEDGRRRDRLHRREQVVVMREVVVTGVGAITPLGVGADTLFTRWAAGEVAVEDDEAPCKDFEPLDFFTRKEARRADRFTQFALASADQAVGQAGWEDDRPYDPSRVGCVLGTGIGGLITLEQNVGALYDGGPEKVAPLAVPLMMGNAGSAAIAMRHDLRGPVFGIVSACAAGANSLATAVRMIQTGDADAALAGGSEAALTPLARAAFGALDATSTVGISRPFDARRDGFIMGEGAGVLVLEDGEKARARGAEILAIVRGVGQTSDAHHLTAPRADGEGAAAAIEAALADAGIGPEDVDYVNAHGTSTPLNDRSETVAIKKALGDHAHE